MKITKQVLSIEQMKELQEVGIDGSNASAMWVSIVDEDFNPIRWFPMLRNDDTPIEVLIEALPLTYKEGNVYYAYTLYDLLRLIPRQYEIGAYNHRNTITVLLDDETGHSHTEISDYSIMEAAFQMVKWCKQNNYI